MLLTILVSLSGCASDIHISADSKLIKSQKVTETAVQYFIGVDDTISINVWKNPELSVSVPVRPDGKISMPLIGDVKAAGLAPEIVAKNIQKELSSFVRNPNVTVMVTGLQSHAYLTRLRVTGAVNTPTSITYRPGMTVIDAILDAGGINDFASPNNTKLYRKIGGKTRVISIYLGNILNDGELETNLDLRPGDVITVPERFF
ncbi:MAG: polysaccharide biosynthesis/export family protein [Thermodesulfovibrionia bacterium]|nr:polysaccharide biosynthesis/export family protein [Thermodesulfovibrionia bacterium]